MRRAAALHTWRQLALHPESHAAGARLAPIAQRTALAARHAGPGEPLVAVRFAIKKDSDPEHDVRIRFSTLLFDPLFENR